MTTRRDQVDLYGATWDAHLRVETTRATRFFQIPGVHQLPPKNTWFPENVVAPTWESVSLLDPVVLGHSGDLTEEQFRRVLLDAEGNPRRASVLVVAALCLWFRVIEPHDLADDTLSAWERPVSEETMRWLDAYCFLRGRLITERTGYHHHRAAMVVWAATTLRAPRDVLMVVYRLLNADALDTMPEELVQTMLDQLLPEVERRCAEALPS